MAKKIVEFLRKKDYRFQEELGQGGTGRTVILHDELLDEIFVCKKYSPINESDRQEYYKNFVEEIKLLHRVYHRNIVRVFNYYLYPDQFTGYIMMEYIKGVDIASFILQNPEKINDIFTQVIDGFKYLEQASILHRDIRPLNILVSVEGIVKIIDFGFGKQVEFNDSFNKSITLNWLYTTPNEFSDKIYDFKTEVYFVGKLFDTLISENQIQEFAYKDILKGMTRSYSKRLNSFFDVSRRITEGRSLYENVFNEYEKGVYRRFVEVLIPVFANMDGTQTYVADVDKILSDLEKIYQSSILEDSVQNVVEVARCFVRGGYKYWREKVIPVEVLKEFLNLFRSIPLEKQNVILTHIWKRLDTVRREIKADDLPF